MSTQVIEKNTTPYPGQYRPVGQLAGSLLGVPYWTSNYLCQSFKAERSYRLLTTKFYVKKHKLIYEDNHVEECFIDLYRANEDGRPTGGVLNSGSFAPTDLYTWSEVDWEQNYELIKDVRYCFTVRQLAVIGSIYTGGERVEIATNAYIYEDGVLSMSNIEPAHSSPTSSPLPDNGWHIPWQAGGGANEDMLFKNYGVITDLIGTISGISSLSGRIKKHDLLRLFIPDRQTDPTQPNYYDPNLFWLPGEWTDSETYVPPAWGDIGDHTYLPLGGGRWQDPLVAIGNNKVYVEDFY